jgi:hypothetical protein
VTQAMSSTWGADTLSTTNSVVGTSELVRQERRSSAVSDLVGEPE